MRHVYGVSRVLRSIRSCLKIRDELESGFDACLSSRISDRVTLDKRFRRSPSFSKAPLAAENFFVFLIFFGDVNNLIALKMLKLNQ